MGIFIETYRETHTDQHNNPPFLPVSSPVPSSFKPLSSAMARAKVVWPPPLPQESAAEKTLRLQKEAEAKRISDSIDAALNAEREQKKRAVYVKILLLGGCFLFRRHVRR